MPRITLDPETLAVESFETSAAEARDSAPPTTSVIISACPRC